MFLVAADAVMGSIVALVATGVSRISFLVSQICIYLIIFIR